MARISYPTAGGADPGMAVFPCPRGSAAGLRHGRLTRRSCCFLLTTHFSPSFGKSLHWPLQSLLGSSPASQPGELRLPWWEGHRNPPQTRGPVGLTASREVGCCGARLSPATPWVCLDSLWGGGLGTWARPRGTVPGCSELGGSQRPPPPPPLERGTFLDRAVRSLGALSPCPLLCGLWGHPCPLCPLCGAARTEQPWLGLG